MNGISIGIDPVVGHFGPLELRWYSLFFATAIAAGVWLATREARRKSLNMDQVQALAIWGIIGGLVGARLFHVVDRWDSYSDDLPNVFAIYNGGLAVYGGLIGGILTGLAYALVHGLPVWRVGDAAAPGMILGQAIGRLACIPNGDALGAPTDVPWAFIYTNPDSMVPRQLLNVPTHPYALYEMIFDLAVLGVLMYLRTKLRIDGTLFLTYVLMYSAGRFLLTYFRVEKIWFLGLQEAQVIALLSIALAVPLLVWRLWSVSRNPDRVLAAL